MEKLPVDFPFAKVQRRNRVAELLLISESRTCLHQDSQLKTSCNTSYFVGMTTVTGILNRGPLYFPEISYPHTCDNTMAKHSQQLDTSVPNHYRNTCTGMWSMIHSLSKCHIWEINAQPYRYCPTLRQTHTTSTLRWLT